MKKISQSTIERLAKYYRTLETYIKEKVEHISSRELAREDGVTSAQVRKDLSFFGTFGKRGYGYDTKGLQDHIADILGLNKTWNLAIVGIGNIGRALVEFNDFKRYGFYIRAIFDSDKKKIGLDYNGLTVHDMASFSQRIKHLNIHIAIIAVQSEYAQSVADLMVAAGIKAIMNFAPRSLRVPKDVMIKNQNIAIGLEALSYYLNNNQNDN
ncbi:MAG: redox-sensing transcriptional repressor Rex [Calditrichaeota bacterium]|nr:redox-sensing transcriptional repressor Rex [Calditrichota bacterium]